MKKLALLSLGFAPLAFGELQWETLSWHGPPGWETNGTSFNIRQWAPGYPLTNQWTWPVYTNIKGTGTVMIVDPMVFRGVTATNAITGVETTIGVGPVSAVHNRL